MRSHWPGTDGLTLLTALLIAMPCSSTRVCWQPLQALEVQITGAFAEHEAKLGQQQEALARQSQKGLATLQARITTLQATLAADSAQHAAAYAELQSQTESVQRDRESACGKGEPVLESVCV